MIFESLVDKKSFFGKLFKPNLLLNSNKVLFKIADEIWFLSETNLQIIIIILNE